MAASVDASGSPCQHRFLTTSGMQFLAVAPLESAAGVTEKPESPITLIDASLRAECARNILP